MNLEDFEQRLMVVSLQWLAAPVVGNSVLRSIKGLELHGKPCFAAGFEALIFQLLFTSFNQRLCWWIKGDGAFHHPSMPLLRCVFRGTWFHSRTASNRPFGPLHWWLSLETFHHPLLPNQFWIHFTKFPRIPWVTFWTNVPCSAVTKIFYWSSCKIPTYCTHPLKTFLKHFNQIVWQDWLTKPW